MAPRTREWTVPAPIRALLWWPPTAFVLVMIDPDAAAGSIAVAGAVLVAVGALVSAVARRSRAARQATQPAQEPSTVEMPTAEMPAARRTA